MGAESFRRYLVGALERAGLTASKLSVLCGKNRSYFHQYLNDPKRGVPPVKSLRQAAPHLGVPEVEFLLRAGYVELSDLRAAALLGLVEGSVEDQERLRLASSLQEEGVAEIALGVAQLSQQARRAVLDLIENLRGLEEGSRASRGT